jgi:hypothetical protein
MAGQEAFFFALLGDQRAKDIVEATIAARNERRQPKQGEFDVNII